VLWRKIKHGRGIRIPLFYDYIGKYQTSLFFTMYPEENWRILVKLT
jgi:hypothetical protein